MTDEEKLTLAQRVAGRKSLRVYIDTMQEELKSSNVEKFELDGRYHTHEALIIDSSGNTVLMKCLWEFSADPKDIETATKEFEEETNNKN